MTKPTGRPVGRPAPFGRGKRFSVYLTPPEQAAARLLGGTVQKGIKLALSQLSTASTRPSNAS